MADRADIKIGVDLSDIDRVAIGARVYDAMKMGMFHGGLLEAREYGGDLHLVVDPSKFLELVSLVNPRQPEFKGIEIKGAKVSEDEEC